MTDATVRIRPEVAHESGQRRGWVKQVTHVDTSSKNGYAFEGQFLGEGKETELPVGALLLHVDPAGSVNRSYKYATLTRLNEDGSEETITEGNWRTEKLTIRDAAADALSQAVEPDLSGISDDHLMKEVKKRPSLMDQLNTNGNDIPKPKKATESPKQTESSGSDSDSDSDLDLPF